MDLKVGQVVLYSDLSPWELATVVELVPEDNEVILDFGFGDDDLCLVSEDGIRTINWLPRDHATKQIAEKANEK